MLRPALLGVLATLAVAHPRVLATSSVGAFDLADPAFSPVCPTEEVWEAKAQRMGLRDKRDACPPEGSCDAPAIRDVAPQAPFTVRLVVHVMRTSAGVPPSGVDAAVVEGQIVSVNEHFAPYGVAFEVLEIQYHDDDIYHCIAPLSYFNQDFLLDIQGMKDAYATQWTQALNVFVGCQTSSIFGVLGGYAIFPWDPDALTARGGLWMNADYFGPDQTVMTHELGHCLGLWHTHRGANETTCTHPCAENVHAADDPLADLVGDFCKDTPGTRANNTCADPPGTDCNGAPWTGTDVANYMSYASASCVDHFTAEQVQRVHCWSRDAIASVLDDQLVLAHVASIQLDSEAKAGNQRRGRARVHVRDAEGAPVAGVTVSVRWSEIYDGEGQAVTDVSGEAWLVTPWLTSPYYCWRVEVTDLQGPYVVYDEAADVVSIATTGKGCSGGPILVEAPLGQATSFGLGASPNPFNPRTTLRFALVTATWAKLDVVDVSGRVVARLLEGVQAAGVHEIPWEGVDSSGRPVASGVYFAVLRTGQDVTTWRLVLLK